MTPHVCKIDGWQPNNAFASTRPAHGVTRLTLVRRLDALGQTLGGVARLETGARMRVWTLQHPHLWERVAGMFLHAGYHLVSETRTRLVLERKEGER